jgi:transcription elongation factor GreB
MRPTQKPDTNERPPLFITPQGFTAMKARYHQLLSDDRPKLVEVISWAAGNGDRSENGDYIYGRKKLREIDRELTHLAKRLKIAKIVDPAQQEDRSRVWFGATVTIADEDDNQRIITLVGEDEADATDGRISFNAPLARAVRGAAIGDTRQVRLPMGVKDYEIIAISYPAKP